MAFIGAYMVSPSKSILKLKQWLKTCKCDIDINWEELEGKYVALRLANRGKDRIIAIADTPIDLENQLGNMEQERPLVLHFPEV